MWHAGREAFFFWTLIGIAVCICLFLIGKAVITHLVLQREAKRPKPQEHDEHERGLLN